MLDLRVVQSALRVFVILASVAAGVVDAWPRDAPREALVAAFANEDGCGFAKPGEEGTFCGSLCLLQVKGQVGPNLTTLQSLDQRSRAQSLLMTEDAATTPRMRFSHPHGADSGGGLSLIFSYVAGQMRKIPERFNNIEVNVAYTSLWGEIASFPARRPRFFNVLMATTKSWLADALVQFRVNGRHNFDMHRSAAFATFGCLYVGLIQWFIYVTMFSLLCPHAIIFANEPIAMKYTDVAGQVDLVKQVIFDTFLVQVFIYYPAFYFIMELITKNKDKLNDAALDVTRRRSKQQQDMPDNREKYDRAPTSMVQRAMQNYQGNFWKDNIMALCVWVPCDVLVFAAPMYMRMPIDHMVSFAWTCILSYIRGGSAGH